MSTEEKRWKIKGERGRKHKEGWDLFMTCISSLSVPDGWPIHIKWGAMALAIMAWGPGSGCLSTRRAVGFRIACQTRQAP